jgi:hypothetical protein
MKHLLLISILCGCTLATTKPQTRSRAVAPPEEARVFTDLREILPPPPVGFAQAVDVEVRDKDSIFEQINGAGVSYLENGMRDALFATFPKPQFSEQDISVELYRFNGATGARAQFLSLNGEEGKAWEGALAVRHDFGLELLAGRHLLRITYNGGPVAQMKVTASVIAKQVLNRLAK